MAKYGGKASAKVARALHERKQGTLRSGGSGRKVTSRKQAIAIGLSEAREAGAKVPAAPAGRKTSGAKKSGGRKRTASGARKASAGKKRAAPAARKSRR